MAIKRKSGSLILCNSFKHWLWLFQCCSMFNVHIEMCFDHFQDCPPDSEDFRAQQCSAHADVRYQGRYHEWLPVDNDPENPCALKCRAKAIGQVVELAPKVLDGTRCYTESLDMCISGACQVSRNFYLLSV